MGMIIAYAFGIIVLLAFCKILAFPIKLLWKLLINAAAGGLGLLIINFFGGFIGIHITINFLTALLVGVLGLPGVIIILIIQMFM